MCVSEINIDGGLGLTVTGARLENIMYKILFIPARFQFPFLNIRKINLTFYTDDDIVRNHLSTIIGCT